MDWTRWHNFTQAEFTCKGDGSCDMKPDFMDKLQALRDAVGFPLPVSSGYRSPAYNAKVSETGENGPHTTGRAVDVLVNGPNAVKVLTAALNLGFTGIGLSQKGPHGTRFIHLDDLTERRPALWTY